MGLIERLIETIIALFIIFVFASIVFPALGAATGVNPIFAIIAMIILAVGIIAAFLKVLEG